MLAIAAGASGVSAVANDSGNELVGGFEIDGNYHEGFDNAVPDEDPQGIDWASVESEYDHIEDLVGGPDETVFDSGAKEADLSTWEDSGSAAAPSNADINNVYVHDLVDESTGDQYAFIAWDRVTDEGTVRWYLELNQLPNTTNENDVSVPDRSDGDLRVSMINQGNGDFDVASVETWDTATATWVDAGTSGVVGATNDSEIAVPGGTLTEELFNEFGFNLTELLDGGDDCTFTGFSTLNLRSQAGLGDQSQLKDYATGPIDIPGRCGDIRIEKRDAEGDLLGGATFEISPDPTPGSDAASLSVTDNENPDADPADGVIVIDPAEPGDYTVTEVTPPPGYIQSDEPQDVTLEEFGSVTVVFENRLGTLTWTKLDQVTAEPVCCATFTVDATDGDAADAGVSLTVVDNGENDADPDPGQILVEDLMTGTYTITETVAPGGYDLPANPSREFTISASTPDVVIGEAFEDPQVTSEIEIVKLDAVTGDELGGATFVVRLDNGDGIFDEADDIIVDPPGEVTTDESGTASVGGLPFGSYWVQELEPPTGYELPAETVQGPFTFDTENAGTTVTVTFEDPQILTDLSVHKLDGADGSDLAGAVFALYLDDGDGEHEAPDGDTLIDQCATGGDGTCTIENLNFGTYYWYEIEAPPGYELPADQYSEMIEVNAGNAGADITAYEFHNPRLPGELTVLKLDESDEMPLAGAVFGLYLDDGDGTYDDADTLAGQCTTGDDGTCTIDDLDFGTYFWVELTPPTGYELPDDPVSTPIVIDASNVDDERSPFVFSDPRLQSEMSVLKLDASDETPLAGAVFELYLDDGDGEQEAPDGDTLIGDCTTGGDGTCSIDGLDFGTYYWYETTAPTGYEVPDNPYSELVVIDASNAGGTTQVTFDDPRIPAELTVLKLAEDTDERLAGAVFELYLDDGDGEQEAPDGDTLVGSCPTGDDGTCTIGNLDFGDYYWYEVQAPDGYLLPANRFSEIISITAQNTGTSPATVAFVDQPQPTPPPSPEPTPSPMPEPTPPDDLPDTGSSSVSGLLLAGLATLLIGGSVVAATRRQKQR